MPELMTTADMVAKSISNPDHSRTFLDGSKRSVVELRSAVIGYGEYLPGWCWSEHAGRQTGVPSERHVGYILSGHLIVRDASGKETTVGPGDAFEVQPGHDARVQGDTPCIALDFTHIK